MSDCWVGGFAFAHLIYVVQLAVWAVNYWAESTLLVALSILGRLGMDSSTPIQCYKE